MQKINDKILNIMFNMDENLNDDYLDQALNYFLSMGYIEDVGIDPETGDKTYRITDYGKISLPHLYEETMSALNQIAFNLWQKDMLEIEFGDDLQPRIRLNENSFNEEKIKLLPYEERYALRQFTQIVGQITDINDII